MQSFAGHRAQLELYGHDACHGCMDVQGDMWVLGGGVHHDRSERVCEVALVASCDDLTSVEIGGDEWDVVAFDGHMHYGVYGGRGHDAFR